MKPTQVALGEMIKHEIDQNSFKNESSDLHGASQSLNLQPNNLKTR